MTSIMITLVLIVLLLIAIGTGLYHISVKPSKKIGIKRRQNIKWPPTPIKKPRYNIFGA